MIVKRVQKGLYYAYYKDREFRIASDSYNHDRVVNNQQWHLFETCDHKLGDDYWNTYTTKRDCIAAIKKVLDGNYG